MKHRKSLSRELAVHFLYHASVRKMRFFSSNLFNQLEAVIPAEDHDEEFTEEVLRGVYDHIITIDNALQRGSKGWSISRLPAIDLAILRLAAYELLVTETPFKVVIDEAIELSKKFSTEDSPRFVNGVLNKLAVEFKRVDSQ